MIKNVKSVKIPNSEGMVGIEASVAMGAILGNCERELMVISHVDTNRLSEVRDYVNSIPNSEGMVGIEASVAMGAILGNCERELMVISHVDTNRLSEVRDYVNSGKINVFLNKGDVKLYIRVEGTCGNDTAMVEIQNYHTNITKIMKNGEEIKGCSCDDKCGGDVMTDRSFLSVKLIYELAKTIDLSLIEPIFQKVIDYNTAIAKEGLTNDWGIAIGKTIKEGIEEGVYGNDIRNNMASFASAGSDARMNGCSMPVMTTSGSGNQGMTASLGVIKFCEMKGISHEELIRGLFFSHMTTIHIKSNIGRLSAYCGAICASAGAAGAISFLDGLSLEQIGLFFSHMTTIHIKSNIGRLSAYCGAICASAGAAGAISFLDGLSLEQITWAIETTLGTLSGVICDGAKSSCATKIASGITCAFDSYYAAKKNRKFLFGEGIVGRDVEATIKNAGILSCATKIASGITCAFDSYYAAKKNRKFLFGEGIVGRDVEATIKNAGILGQDGMKVTDEVILDIMINNK